MGLILKKTFEGHHVWVKIDEKIKLDCMFFTTTSEEVNHDDETLKYKKLPTFILCNPNAMFY